MRTGPVEFLVVEFPGTDIDPQVPAAIAELVAQGTIRVLDVLVARKDLDGAISVTEIHDLDEGTRTALDVIDGEYGGLVSEDDAALAAEAMTPGTTCGLLVWENVWATRFAAALDAAGGRVLAREPIPADAIDTAFAALAD
jgi:hypothetical protein